MAATLEKNLARNVRSDPVSGLSCRPPCAVQPHDSVAHVVREMTARGVGCALVLDDAGGPGDPPGHLIGIFTESDFLARIVALGRDVDLAVRHVMTPAPRSISATGSVLEAIELMDGGHYRHLPVLGPDDRVIGVVSLKDIIHYLVEYFPAAVYNLPPTPMQAQPAREGA